VTLSSGFVAKIPVSSALFRDGNFPAPRRGFVCACARLNAAAGSAKQQASPGEHARMDRKQFLAGLIALAVIVLGVAAWFVFFGSAGNDETATADDLQYSFTLTPYDRTLGSPKAPLTVVEYAAPTCPFCAHFFMSVFPQFKKDWIDTGKAHFVFRVFPLRAADVAAEAMARCLPARRYFAFIDLLYRNQDKWDPDGHNIPDVHAALVRMGAMAGMTAAQVDSCIANKAATKRIADIGQQAAAKYGIDETPTIFANGQVVLAISSYEAFNAALTAIAGKK
jgi:protein-disulfide isomerase